MRERKIAAAPISWGVSEVPGWGIQLLPERVLADAQRLGFRAMEAGEGVRTVLMPRHAAPHPESRSTRHAGLAVEPGAVAVADADPAAEEQRLGARAAGRQPAIDDQLVEANARGSCGNRAHPPIVA